MDWQETALHLGILGAGQLGAYLARAARTLQIDSTVLMARPDDVAAEAATHTVMTTADPCEAVTAMAHACDVLTFEKEDVPVVVLEALRTLEAAGVTRVVPSVDVLLRLQNKALQKRWLTQHGFPTARFLELEDPAVGTVARDTLGEPYVLKTQRGGYDGLGVKIVREPQHALVFAGVPSIAEAFVAEKRELAVLVARGNDGVCSVYPVAEMVFDDVGNVLRHVLAPAPVPPATAEAATALGRSVIEALGGVGVFAVELFLTPDNKLLINEISPRVHNTGHLTLDAYATSQFEQHVRAVTGFTLAPIAPWHPAAMINILCEPALEAACRSGRGVVRPADHVAVHWYGKTELRPLRKMGHINAWGDTVEAALARAQGAGRALEQPGAAATGGR